MIQTNKISEPAQLNNEQFITADLQPLFFQYFTQEALYLISKRTFGTIHQYNRYHKWGSDHNEKLTNLLQKLELKNHSLFESQYTREIAKVLYFGISTTEDRVAEAAIKMVNVINDLARDKHALATLTPLTSIQFNTFDSVGNIVPGKKFAVLSYLAIDPQYESLVQSKYADFLFQEGSIPPELK